MGDSALTRWPHLTAVLCLVLAVSALPARAEDAPGNRVIGWGYAFDLPPRFTPRADDPPPRSRILDEVLIWSLPLRVMGEPRRAGWGSGPVEAPEATLRACRFVLAEDRAPESVLDIAEDAIRGSYQEVVDTLTMSSLQDCAFKQTRTGIPVVMAKITYKHHASGPRFVQSALFLKETTGLVITLEAPYDLQFEYEAYFIKLVDSVKLMDPAPTLMEQVKLPGLILMSLLVLYLVVLIVRRRKREKASTKPVPRIQVIDSTPANLTRASLADDEPSVEELGPLDPQPGAPNEDVDEELVMPSASADPGPKARPGLKSTRESAAATEGASDEQPSGSPKITRNADFLG